MDPLDAFPPMPSGPVHQGPTARVERADADRQRERARDDEHSESGEDEPSFEEELEDAYEHPSDREQTAEGTADERPPGQERRASPEPYPGRGEDDPGPHIDISV